MAIGILGILVTIAVAVFFYLRPPRTEVIHKHVTVVEDPLAKKRSEAQASIVAGTVAIFFSFFFDGIAPSVSGNGIIHIAAELLWLVGLVILFFIYSP